MANPSITVDADTQVAKRKLDQLKQELREVGSRSYQAKLLLDTKDARARLKQLKKELVGTGSNQQMKLKLGIDTKQARTQLKEFRGQIRSNKFKTNMPIGVNTKQARQELKKLREDIRKTQTNMPVSASRQGGGAGSGGGRGPRVGFAGGFPQVSAITGASGGGGEAVNIDQWKKQRATIRSTLRSLQETRNRLTELGASSKNIETLNGELSRLENRLEEVKKGTGDFALVQQDARDAAQRWRKEQQNLAASNKAQQRALSDLEKEQQNQIKQQANIRKHFQRNLKSVKPLKDQLRQLGGQSSNIEELENASRNYARTLQNTASTQDDVAKAQQRLTSAKNRAKQEAKELSASTRETTSNTRRLGSQSERTGGLLTRMTKNLNELTRKLRTVGFLLGGAIAQTVAWRQEIAGLGAAIGGVITNLNLEPARNQLQNMGASTDEVASKMNSLRDTADESGVIFGRIASEMANFTSISQTNGQSFEEARSSLEDYISAQSSFGEKTGDIASRLSDLNEISKQSSTDFGELTDAVSFLQDPVGQLNRIFSEFTKTQIENGAEIDNVQTAISRMVSGIEYADDAVRGLDSAFASLINEATELFEIFNRTGVIDSMALAMRKLTATEEVKSAFQALGEAVADVVNTIPKKIKELVRNFDTVVNAVGAVSGALIGSAAGGIPGGILGAIIGGTEQWREVTMQALTDIIKGFGDFVKNLNTVTSQAKSVLTSITDAFASAFNSIKDALEAVPVVSSIVSALEQVEVTVRGLSQAILSVLVAGGIGRLVTAITTQLIPTINMARASLAGFTASIQSSFSTAMGGAASRTSMAVTVMSRLGTVLGPIVGIISAVGMAWASYSRSTKDAKDSTVDLSAAIDNLNINLRQQSQEAAIAAQMELLSAQSKVRSEIEKTEKEIEERITSRIENVSRAQKDAARLTAAQSDEYENWKDVILESDSVLQGHLEDLKNLIDENEKYGKKLSDVEQILEKYRETAEGASGTNEKLRKTFENSLVDVSGIESSGQKLRAAFYNMEQGFNNLTTASEQGLGGAAGDAINKAIRQWVEQIKEANPFLNKHSDLIEDIQNKYNITQKAALDVAKSMSKQSTELAKLNAEVGNGTATISDLFDAHEELDKQVNKTGETFEIAGKKADGFFSSVVDGFNRMKVAAQGGSESVNQEISRIVESMGGTPAMSGEEISRMVEQAKPEIQKLKEEYEKFARKAKQAEEAGNLDIASNLAKESERLRDEMLKAESDISFEDTSSFTDDMAQGIHSVTTAVDDLTTAWEKQAKVMEWVNQREKTIKNNTKKGTKERRKAMENLNEERVRLTEEGTKAELSSYSKLFGTMKQMTSEQSAARKRLHQLEMAFASAEIAIEIQKATQKAITAIMQQGQGDPYTAPARMAAMAGFVASFGLSVGGSGSSSGGGSGGPPGRQEKQGKGSVLGMPDTASESISNSVEATADATESILGVNTQMLTALESVQEGLAGAAGLIARDQSGFNFNFDNTFDAAENVKDTISDLTFKMLGLDVAFQKVFGENWVSEALGDIGGGEKSVKDKGIKIIGDKFTDIMNDTLVQSYAKIKESGGWFSSSDTYTKIRSVSDDIEKQFQTVFKSMGESVRQGVKQLGMSSKEIDRAFEQYELETRKISLKGLNAEEKQEELNKVFSKIFDNLAGSISPNWLKEFQEAGEGLEETLARVAANVEAADTVLAKMGKSIRGDLEERAAEWTKNGQFNTPGSPSDAPSGIERTTPASLEWEASEKKIAELSNTLVEAAGGAGKLNDKVNGFIDNFLTQEQKIASKEGSLQKQFGNIRKEFDSFNKELPDTRKGFTDLVEGIDLTSEKNVELYEALLSVSDATDEYYSMLEEREQKLASLRVGNENIFGEQNLQTEITAAGLKGTDVAELLKDRDLNLRSGSEAAKELGNELIEVAQSLDNTSAAIELFAEKLKEGVDELELKSQFEDIFGKPYIGDRLNLSGATDELISVTRQAATGSFTAGSTAIKQWGDKILNTAESGEAANTALQILSEQIVKTKDDLEATRSEFKDIADTLNEERKDLATEPGVSPLSPAARLDRLESEFSNTLERAKSGNAEAMKKLPSLSRDFLEASKEVNQASSAYTQDWNKVQKGLANTETIAEQQLAVAERQLKELEQQTNVLTESSGKNSTPSNISSSSIPDLSEASNPEKAIESFISKNKEKEGLVEDALRRIYQEGFGRKADFSGLEYWTDEITEGTLAATDLIESMRAGSQGSDVLQFASGGVIGGPTAFSMGDRAGLAGESGPEAIMPVTRTSNGDLGVKAEGTGGNTINAPIEININGEGKDSEEIADEVSNRLREELPNIAKELKFA